MELMKKLSDNDYKYVKSELHKYINESLDISLNEDIKNEKIQEELIARAIFKKWLDLNMPDR